MSGRFGGRLRKVHLDVAVLFSALLTVDYDAGVFLDLPANDTRGGGLSYRAGSLPEADHRLAADAIKPIVISRRALPPKLSGKLFLDGVFEVSGDPLSGLVEDDGHGLVVDHAPVALST